MAYVPGHSNQRPTQGSAVVVSIPAMTFESNKLQQQAILLQVASGLYQPTMSEVAWALHGQLRIPLHNIRATRHQPVDFFAHFDHPN